MTECRYCKSQFDWNKLTQVKTGLVQCPQCLCLVDILGNRFDFVVGDFVYKHYTPQSPGKIISATPAPVGGYFPEYKVKWLKDKSITIEPENYLADFNALIEDHKKKLNTHISKLHSLALL